VLLLKSLVHSATFLFSQDNCPQYIAGQKRSWVRAQQKRKELKGYKKEMKAKAHISQKVTENARNANAFIPDPF
jgi:hypothetical protein